MQQLRKTLGSDLRAGLDLVSQELVFDHAAMPARINQILAGLRDKCLAGYTKDFIDVVAQMAGALIEMHLPADDLALLTGKHIVDGMAAIVIQRRAKMRATEQAFEQATGRPWSAPRMYTLEENADDTTVPVLRGAGFAPDGIAPFFLDLMTPDTRNRCLGFVDHGKTPPYGVDLVDEHHGVCYRVHHVRAVVAEGASGKRAPVKTTSPTGASEPKKRIPYPTRYSDLIMY